MGGPRGQVLKALSDLKVVLAATMTKMQGVVISLDEVDNRAATIKYDLMCELNTHVSGCPIRSRMAQVKEFIAVRKGKQAADAHCMAKLWPLVSVVTGICAYLVLAHAGEILRPGSRNIILTMHTLRVFLAVFGGFLAVGGLSFRIGKGLYAISKWVERKTGSSSLAYDGVPILFAVLAMSVVLTAAIVSRSASAAR